MPYEERGVYCHDSKSQISREATVLHKEVMLLTAAGAEHLHVWYLLGNVALWMHLVHMGMQTGMWPRIDGGETCPANKSLC